MSVVDIYRFKPSGRATLIGAHVPGFQVLATELLATAGPDFSIRHVIPVVVAKASLIWAPYYMLAAPPRRT